jgi:hypothetical protein
MYVSIYSILSTDPLPCPNIQGVITLHCNSFDFVSIFDQKAIKSSCHIIRFLYFNQIKDSFVHAVKVMFARANDLHVQSFKLTLKCVSVAAVDQKA